MVRPPQEHAQVLGALLGQVACECEPKDCVGGVAQANASPWLRQFWEDVLASGGTDEGTALLEDLEGSLCKPCEGPQVFLSLDPSVLRATELTVEVPPLLGLVGRAWPVGVGLRAR
eukprot:9494626-Pyramimonas_sp.AAC.1